MKEVLRELTRNEIVGLPPDGFYKFCRDMHHEVGISVWSNLGLHIDYRVRRDAINNKRGSK